MNLEKAPLDLLFSTVYTRVSAARFTWSFFYVPGTKKNWVRVRNILMLIIIINIRHTNSNMFISIRVRVAVVLYLPPLCKPFVNHFSQTLPESAKSFPVS